MKKMILLLILPLTASMAIDFTMTKEGLFVESSSTIQPPTSGMVPEANNPYLEPVNLPKCDAGNPEVQFIRSTADWSKINSSSKRIFCVSPGNYTSLGNITLTASGTSEKRRYIVLNNGNDTHPGKLDSSELMNCKLRFKNASYWTVDRYSAANIGDYVITLSSASSHNIFNRMYTTQVGSSMWIKDGAHNNTVQNSRFENQLDPGYDGPVCVQLGDLDAKYFQIHNNKIINNEFYNQNDAIQLMRAPLNDGTRIYQGGNFEGTVIDSNSFYKDIPYMENAMDIKCGGDNSTNPIIISNNRIWGYTQHPDFKPGAYVSGFVAIMAHIGPKNIHIYNNIFWDNDVAINSGPADPIYGFQYSLTNSKVYNNIVHRCGNASKGWYPFHLIAHNNTYYNDNYIIAPKNKLAYTYAPSGGSLFSTTKVVEPYNDIADFKGHTSFPWSSSYSASLNTKVELSRTNFTDYVFTWSKFTNNPEEITLSNILDPNGSIVSPN